MPTDTARTRADAYVYKIDPDLDKWSSVEHVKKLILAGCLESAAAQLAEIIMVVEALKLKASRRGGDLHAVQPLMQVLEALRRLQDVKKHDA